jgi:hypothetical protein
MVRREYGSCSPVGERVKPNGLEPWPERAVAIMITGIRGWMGDAGKVAVGREYG